MFVCLVYIDCFAKCTIISFKSCMISKVFDGNSSQTCEFQDCVYTIILLTKYFLHCSKAITVDVPGKNIIVFSYFALFCREFLIQVACLMLGLSWSSWLHCVIVRIWRTRIFCESKKYILMYVAGTHSSVRRCAFHLH